MVRHIVELTDDLFHVVLLSLAFHVENEILEALLDHHGALHGLHSSQGQIVAHHDVEELTKQ